MTEQMEKWLPCPGFEGFYEVSDHGRIRRIAPNSRGHKISGKVLKQFPSKRGYFQVRLYKHGTGLTCRTHQLVARAFVDNPNNFPEVHHADDNKANNRADNLEWLTQDEHRKRTIPLYHRGEKTTMSVLTESQIIEIRSRPYQFGDYKKWAEEFGVCQSAIYAVISGRNWKHVKKPVASVPSLPASPVPQVPVKLFG